MITSITTQKTTMKRRLISLILLSAASGALTAQDEVAPKKRDRHDALKACFASEGGEIRVNGRSVSTISSANCRIYKFDSSLDGSGAEVSFVGPLEIVVLEDAALRYLGRRNGNVRQAIRRPS